MEAFNDLYKYESHLPSKGVDNVINLSRLIQAFEWVLCEYYRSHLAAAQGSWQEVQHILYLLVR